MKRFRRHGHESHRDKLKQELFQFNKASYLGNVLKVSGTSPYYQNTFQTVEHGFPHQPSALSYSPSLELLAIGTRSGAIKLYGAPGVEFMGLHDENAAVTQVHFLPNQVELVTLLDDNSLHMWTLRAHQGLSELLEIGRFTLTGPPGAPPSVTRVTAVLAHSSGELLLLGTEGGHVFIVEVPGFRELEERNISLDQMASSVPDDYIGRRNLEHVEALQENPVNPDQVVIGYGRGLVVIWDLVKQCALQHIPATQQMVGIKLSFPLSPQPWPITGGQNLAPDPPQRDLLLTGHEDGTVRFWDASGVCLNPMYKLSTAGVFHTDADPNDNMNSGSEGEWPPFRKVGCFDPYSDDPRLGIQKIHLCKYSGYLTVAGTAGQILVLELNDEAAEQTVEAKIVDLLQGQEGFRWKGHTRLDMREEPVLSPPGFQPFCLVQCQPPAVVTALTLHSEWKLVAFGTSHGFGLFDYQQKNTVFVKCTLNPSDQLAMEGPLSRVKSIKKSLRQSFRRIRRSRVSLRKHHINNAAKLQEANARLEAELAEMELAPVQRKIEARSSDDSFTGLVRTLYFADTFLSDRTNGGCVFAYMLRLPNVEHRADEPVTAQQAKEIQLMHRAPVVGIVILDGHGVPLPEPLEVAHDLARSPDMHGLHHLLVISEEQFKVFTLPKVSAKMKLKLTALDGSRVRRAGVAWFGSNRSEDYCESGLVVLTNQGDLHVVSLPNVKMQVHYPCIRREDVSGIASCVFTKHGQGFYLISPSEFERFSLSTRHVVEPRSLVEVPLYSASSNQCSSQPDGVTRHLRQDSEDAESAARRVMEHALLNDESEYLRDRCNKAMVSCVLQEIQKSLEADPS
ncbi:Lethal(2) giant larvae protein -like protein 2 [Takifugu flavidus]|uniref:LLGL scribble cell polarity complex component 2 n=1 Tax=Takifugu flavidus TaxID=433684 RepID=A0A5C6PSV0_9TELE|nr:Lethal(2) giant larvae protein -like protein 2 [Takifugu flavidus]